MEAVVEPVAVEVVAAVEENNQLSPIRTKPSSAVQTNFLGNIPERKSRLNISY
jgi:hypothetical protein